MGTTPLGGVTQTFVNGTGAASIPGTIVKRNASDPTTIEIALSTDDDPIGVVFDSVAANANCEVVVSGAAYVLLALNTPCARGQRIGVSTTEPGYGEYDSEPSWVGQAAESVPKPGSGNRCFVLANVEPAGITSATMPDVSMTRTLYVDVNALDGGDGSLFSPFNSIQDAVDAALVITPPSQAWVAPVAIEIGPGVYTENVVIRTDCTLRATGGTGTVDIYPTTGVAVTITNATTASLAAYRAGGSVNYALLVNDGSLPLSGGPGEVTLCDLVLYSSDDWAIECLGVKGDASPTTTNFLNTYGLSLDRTTMLGSHPGAYLGSARFKNCGTVIIYPGSTMSGLVSVENCFYFESMSGTLVGASFTADYQAASPDGRPDSAGNFSEISSGSYINDITVTNEASVEVVMCRVSEVVVSDTGAISFQKCYIKHNAVASDTAQLYLYDTFVVDSLVVGATAIVVLLNSYIYSTTSITAGLGTVTAVDSKFNDLITDASNKLVHAGEDRYGYYDEAGGGGTRAVAFTPNFPNGATINVQITFESLGGAYQTGMIANGTLAHTGFSLTTGGNGRFHWHAHKTK